MKKTIWLVLIIAISASTIAQNDKGWVSLFDGKTLNGWTKTGSGVANYSVEDGAIVGTTVFGGNVNTFLAADKKYGDFILELEVKIDDTLSNSGIQFRSRFLEAPDNKSKVIGYQYELDPAARRWTGGIYEEGIREWLYPMSLNPSAQNAFKVGQYNKVKIECIGRHIKTWVNGVAAAYVVDSNALQGLIALQVHRITKPELAGKKIYWRNIRIKTTGLVPSAFPKNIFVVNNIPNTLSDYEKKEGWKLLFDGKTSKGWTGVYKTTFPDKGWAIKDGILGILSPGEKEISVGGDIITTEQYGAFDLSFEFNISAGGNSGVKYGVILQPDKKGAIGLEYQLLDDTLHPDAKMGIDGNRTLASLYDLIKANKTTRFIHQPGNWNTGRIVVYPNNHVEHYLNGIKVLEYERGSQSYRDLVAISKYKVYPGFGESKKAYILLQDHGHATSFRSIKIKVLK